MRPALPSLPWPRAARLACVCLLFGCEADPDASVLATAAEDATHAPGPAADAAAAGTPDARYEPMVAPEPRSDGDADSSQTMPLDAAPAPDAATPDATPDAATPDGTPDAAAPAPGPFGLTPEQIATIVGLRRADAPPPDPTNAYADDEAAARLGHRLFFDATLSRNGLDSCSGCHWPDRYFSGILTYDGHGGLDFRNVPSLVDVSQHDWFFWDGRADSLWAQVRTPIESPHELDFDRVRLAHFIHGLPLMRADYEAAFGRLPDAAFWSRIPNRAKPSTEVFEALLDTAWANMAEDDRQRVNLLLANVGKALAAFQRTLITGPAPFDVFTLGLETGDPVGLAALDESAVRGLRLFVGEAGCVQCHSGPTLSDSAFHNLGVARLPGGPLDEGRAAGIPQVLADVFNAAGPFSDDPAGDKAQRLARLDVDAEDAGAFRTATLRNVGETPPYMHDGRFVTLEEVVRFKATLPDEPAVGARDERLVPFAASDQDVADLVAFLQSLTAPPVAEALRTPLP